MDVSTTEDVRAWLRAIEGQPVTPEMIRDLRLALEAALDYIDDNTKTSSRHPLYPDR